MICCSLSIGQCPCRCKSEGLSSLRLFYRQPRLFASLWAQKSCTFALPSSVSSTVLAICPDKDTHPLVAATLALNVFTAGRSESATRALCQVTHPWRYAVPALNDKPALPCCCGMAPLEALVWHLGQHVPHMAHAQPDRRSAAPACWSGGLSTITTKQQDTFDLQQNIGITTSLPPPHRRR